MLARAGETAVEVQLIRPAANFDHWGKGVALPDECPGSHRAVLALDKVMRYFSSCGRRPPVGRVATVSLA